MPQSTEHHSHHSDHSYHHHHHHHHHRHHHHRHHSNRNKILAIVLSILGVLIAAVGVLVWYTAGTYHYVKLNQDELGLVDVSAYHQEILQKQVDRSSQDSDREDTEIQTTTVTEPMTELSEEQQLSSFATADNPVMNMILIGTDSSQPEASDGEMILDSVTLISINQDTNTAKAAGISIDRKLNQEGKEPASLKEIYNQQGTVPLIRSINQNLMLDIANYITVDFAKLEPVLDATNGMEMSLTHDEAQLMGERMRAGMNDFTPQDMLTYIHLPLTDGFHTQEYRQQNTLNFLLKRCKSEDLTKYPELIRKFLDSMETSLTVGDARALIGSIQDIARQTAWIFLNSDDATTSVVDERHIPADERQVSTLHEFLYSNKDNATS